MAYREIVRSVTNDVYYDWDLGEQTIKREQNQ